MSELMLQQTQVARVIERLPRFLARFPTPPACASLPLGEVIDEWAGLGYNRRAVNLHRAAEQIVELHDGKVPIERADLLALPGVGPYTARAVRAFAFERDDGVVDTNVARVLARTGGISLSRSDVQERADRLVPAGEGWNWNQAVMELGALVCRPVPRCEQCPVVESCRWGSGGRVDADPAVGSAGVSTGQSRFDGSDRQGRGRLVDALRAGPVATAELPTVMGWPDDRPRAERVAATVVADGLAEHSENGFSLPS